MIVRNYLIYGLLLAMGALAAINEKGIVFLCTVVDNVKNIVQAPGTQVNLVVKNVASASVGSICQSLQKYFNNKSNHFDQAPVSCAVDSTNDYLNSGILVPSAAQKTGTDAVGMVVQALRDTIQGDIDFQLLNVPDNSTCLSLDFDQSAVDTNANNHDTSTIYPGAKINIPIGHPDPQTYKVNTVKLSISGQKLTLPDANTIKSNLDTLTNSIFLGVPGQYCSFTVTSIVNGLSGNLMFDLGGPNGFPGVPTTISAEDWKFIIGMMVDTLAAEGNENDCVAFTATGDPSLKSSPSELSMVVQFCFS